MRLGIIGAIPEEVDILKEMMEITSIESISNRVFYCGKLYGIDSVIVFSRWGKVASAITTSILIHRFSIDKVIFTGVAGAVSTDLEIGDVVIATKLYQHDLDPRPIFPLHNIPLTNTVFLESDSDLNELAITSVKQFFDVIDKYITADDLSLFKISKPKVLFGIIATGDQFIHLASQKNKIISDMSDVLAVEMEGASVAHACVEHNIPFTIIRVISDKSDKGAEIDFTAFINMISKIYINVIVENMLKQMLSSFSDD